MSGFIPYLPCLTFVETAKLEFEMSFFTEQYGLQKRDNQPEQQSKTAQATESAQQHLMLVRQKNAELEKRMNYKAQPLSEEQQDILDAKFRSAYRMKRWPDES